MDSFNAQHILPCPQHSHPETGRTQTGRYEKICDGCPHNSARVGHILQHARARLRITIPRLHRRFQPLIRDNTLRPSGMSTETWFQDLDYNVCTKRRGIYSALTGALRDLRLRVFKPLAKADLRTMERERMSAASRILKLFLVSCYGVTIRIHGLASPLLGEAITAYGRYVLQSTWDMAKSMASSLGMVIRIPSF